MDIFLVGLSDKSDKHFLNRCANTTDLHFVNKIKKGNLNMQTFLVRYNKETVDKQTNQLHIEEKEHYLQAEDFGQAYEKAHAISSSCCVEVLDINTITKDVTKITKRIQYLTECLNNGERKNIEDVIEEYKQFQLETNNLEKAKNKLVFQEVKKTDEWKDVPTSI